VEPTTTKTNFVFDLDGTICFAGKPLSDTINTALSDLLDLGHAIIFASARPIRDMLPVIDKRFHHCPMIGGNGSLISIDGQIVHRFAFSDEVLSQLLTLIDAQQATYLIDSDWDYAYTGPVDHPILQYVDGGGLARKVELAALPSIVKILILTASNMKQVEDQLKGLPVVVHQHRDSPSLDISPPGITKWSALSWLGLSEGSYIAFGNDANDIEMFRRARYSVMIGHHEQLAPYADDRIAVDAVIEQKVARRIRLEAEKITPKKQGF